MQAILGHINLVCLSQLIRLGQLPFCSRSRSDAHPTELKCDFPIEPVGCRFDMHLLNQVNISPAAISRYLSKRRRWALDAMQQKVCIVHITHTLQIDWSKQCTYFMLAVRVKGVLSLWLNQWGITCQTLVFGQAPRNDWISAVRILFSSVVIGFDCLHRECKQKERVRESLGRMEMEGESPCCD